MKRWTNKWETLRQQAQLVGARRDRSNARPRADVSPGPPSHVPADQGEEPVQATGAPPAAPRRSRMRRERTQQPQDVLGKLLHNDVASHELAQQLWWKWRHMYLPAKEAELQRRRPQVVAGDTDDGS